MKKLPQKAKINIDNHKITLADTGDMFIRFFFKHVQVQKTLSSHNVLYMDIEKKLYTNSNHSTKISFWTPDGKEEKRKKQVEDFINKLMSGITPVPRFSLGNYIESPGQALNTLEDEHTTEF